MSMPAEESQRGRWLTQGQLPSPLPPTLASSDPAAVTTSESSTVAIASTSVSSSSPPVAVPSPVQVPATSSKKEKKANKPVSMFQKDWETILCRIIYTFRHAPSHDAPRHLAKDLLAAIW
jgi:CHASE1-domain containing sensor protein